VGYLRFSSRNKHEYHYDEYGKKNGEKIKYMLALTLNSGYSKILSILIQTITQKISFLLFPNPVKDKLTVKINGEIEIGILKIVDSLGKTIFQQDIKKNQKEILIDANKFSEGYYILQISSSNYIGNQKFIK
jgi:hypothetical protein